MGTRYRQPSGFEQTQILDLSNTVGLFSRQIYAIILWGRAKNIIQVISTFAFPRMIAPRHIGTNVEIPFPVFWTSNSSHLQQDLLSELVAGSI